MLSVIRAEIGRARRRRAVWLLGFITLAILAIYSWTNHSAVASNRRSVELLRQPGQPPSSEDERRSRQHFIESLTEQINTRRSQLSPGESYHFLLGYFGTAMGVTISVLLASTMVGADFRWGYWKTLTAHEPRRWRLVVSKFVALWLLILVGLMIVLGLSFPLNSLFAQLYEVRPLAGFPQSSELLSELGRAWLVNCVYGSLAAAIVLVSRSNLAGLGGSLGLTLADGLLSQKYSFLGYGSPAQQVVALFPGPDRFSSFNDVPGVQWFRASESFEVIRVGGQLTMKAGPKLTIPDERAAAFLIAWALVAVMVAILAVRSRDLPA